MMLSVVGNNVSHLNSEGFQIQVSPIRYETMAACEEERKTMISMVEHQLALHALPIRLSVSAVCKPFEY
jgi:hypothetical protein